MSNSTLIQKLEELVKASDTAWEGEPLKVWDKFRKFCVDYPGASLPRDIFESWLVNINEAAKDALKLAKEQQREISDKWADEEDDYTPHIEASHPLKNGDHKTYELASKLVSNRHSKGALIELVNYLLRQQKRESVTQWQPIETAPENTTVFIHYKNTLGKGRTIKATFIKRWTVESDPEDDNCEYNEEKDCYFTPEGWYEEIDNWDDFSSVAICKSNKITHWMPLPKPPESGEGV